MAKVVVVESNAHVREWVRLHLQTEGHEIHALPDAARAFDILRADPADLVLVASDLPDSSGFGLVAALRSNLRTASIPVILLVPQADPAAQAQAKSIEPEGVLVKPTSRTVLLEMVTSKLYKAATNTGFGMRAADLAPGEPDSAEQVSGVLLESKEATVLLVVLRNLVTLARSLRGRTLEAILRRFYGECREAVTKQGGWVLRMDATGLSALFEEGPNADRHHCTRAVEAALMVVLGARRTRQWAAANLTDLFVPPLSVGCGVHMGPVIVSRISVTGTFTPSIAGPAVELAQRLDGRAKGLSWSVAASGSAAALAGPRFLYGREATLTDTDHGTTIPIVEVLGFNPGMARPGELVTVTEAREAVLANTVLARLAGDVDPSLTDRTVVFSAHRPAADDRLPDLGQRRIARRLAQGAQVTTYSALNVAMDREEVVKTMSIAEAPVEFVERYLADYRRIGELEQRNVVTVYETGRTDSVAFVALEALGGGSMVDAIGRRVPIGAALNYVAQMSLALDAVHSLGIFHGALGPEHFLFRNAGVVVLADFNVTSRIMASLMPTGARLAGDGPADGDAQAGRRLDFKALGLMLCQLLGVIPPNVETSLDMPAASLEKVLEIPLALSALKSCIHGLLGIAGHPGFERAEEVLVELLALRDTFPFDLGRGGDGEAPVSLLA